MSFIINHAAEKQKDIADKRLYWEMLKVEIRKAYTERNIGLDLLQKLEEMNLRIDATPENKTVPS